MSEVKKAKGVYTGVLDVVVAHMTSEDVKGEKPVYESPQVLGESIEVTITPKYAEGELSASNAVYRRAKRVVGYDCKFNLAAIAPAMQNYVLGRETDKNGVSMLGSSGLSAPVCAVGLCRTKDNGAMELWWLYRAQFAEPESTGKTETPGSIEYQTPTISCVCDRRISDGRLGAVADSDDESIPESVIDGWFDAVYEYADVAAASAQSE